MSFLGLVMGMVGIFWMFVAMLPVWPYTWMRRRFCSAIGAVLFLVGALLVFAGPAEAATPATAQPALRATVQVPEVSAMYRRWVEQAVAEEWGVDGSPARLAAQLHQESSWNPNARSAVGAEGLAQFMPSTARWIAQQFPDRLGGFDPWDPQQAALAAAIYDAWLAQRNPGAGQCSTWSFALSAYNGGEGNLRREQALAVRAGRDRRRWAGNVADMRSRSTAAWRENRAYVSRILTVLEPAYIDAGWAGQAVCA
ncbi:transglycosylase SLT domain-containing protein [Frateuria sp. YIM B11624]|uniref:transglycosylase SLT domain-containing protein n=1 Tax=Frateuria sp. YIM B11624 TaxID=3143185 RepID=UPI003C771DCD